MELTWIHKMMMNHLVGQKNKNTIRNIMKMKNGGLRVMRNQTSYSLKLLTNAHAMRIIKRLNSIEPKMVKYMESTDQMVIYLKRSSTSQSIMKLN